MDDILPKKHAVAAFAIFFLIFQVASPMAEDEYRHTYGQPCPPGRVMDLNGKCVKKFVVPKRKKCPEPDIRFGGFEFRGAGRIVDFWCEDGWRLAPESRYAMCKLGRWDRDIPRCVRPGCQELPLPLLSPPLVEEEMDGALLRFRCPEGADTRLVGAPVLDCNGDVWNGTAPTCGQRSWAGQEEEPADEAGGLERKPRTGSRESGDRVGSGVASSSKPGYHWQLTLLVLMTWAWLNGRMWR